MSGYDLQYDEVFVHKQTGVGLGGRMGQLRDELLLTSKNIVLMQKGVWGGDKGVLVFPLNQIKIHSGKAQALTGEARGFPTVDVYFTSGQEQFRFSSRSHAKEFAGKVNEVLTGTPYAAKERDDSIAGVVAGTMKDTVDSFKNAFGITAKEQMAQAAAAAPVAGRCGSCRAPISGMRGRAATCSYCDMVTQL